MADQSSIESLYSEERRFPPDPAFTAQAVVSDPSVYDEAAADPLAWWAERAKQLEWSHPWTEVLQWKLPFAKWFVGGKLNVSVNCLDRHISTGGGEKVAFYFEGEPGDNRTFTYRELLDEVCRLANALKSLGIRKGDRVAIYMPMIPELPVAMLACARIGAVHSVVFGGFSAEALAGRIQDAGARLLVTADGGWRRGQIVPIKQNADEAVTSCPTIEKMIVVKRVDQPLSMSSGKDLWYHELIEDQPTACMPEQMDSEDLLFTLYTSGTTAKPKGIVHTSGGYLTGVSTTHQMIFDIKPDDVYWCAADIGWVTGHSYIVYGPLANHTTGILYEGTPDWPDKDRFWSIVEKYRATILYTAPTAIRAFMKWGAEHPAKHDLSSLRLLGSVGEPINPEAWMWYRENIGGGQTPVVDTWWQTETGAIMITPLPGLSTLKPGSASRGFPATFPEIVDDDGKPVKPGTTGGFLTITQPWPSMLRGIWGDPDRYLETYWSRFPGRYFAGDGCRQDAEGDFWFMGRVDDVMNISGHRISTTEVESALVDHPAVAEAAVVGKNDPDTGQAIFAYVIARESIEPTETLAAELREHVAKKIGKIARPKQIMFTPELPKTRSGKIMRRLLRDVAEERTLGDVTTLADPGIVEQIRRKAAEGEG
ncbi:MAG TPA: acetate--CoA ligase [Actinomycetota bacterium]|nr:acetate--CoA ligase [Actinomycetota bacterium]